MKEVKREMSNFTNLKQQFFHIPKYKCNINSEKDNKIFCCIEKCAAQHRMNLKL